MSKSSIPYVDTGWNHIIGCKGGPSLGCQHCWARFLHNMRHNAFKNGKHMPQQYAVPFHTLQFLTDRFNEPASWTKKRTVAVCFQSELFAPEIPHSVITTTLATMEQLPQHTFLLLTKRPIRMKNALLDFFGAREIPNHIYPGVSVCSQQETEIIPEMLPIRSTNLWLSFEPLILEINLNDIPDLWRFRWSVIGCESGSRRRECPMEWIISLSEKCAEFKMKIFIKQISMNSKIIYDPDFFPEYIKKRETPFNLHERDPYDFRRRASVNAVGAHSLTT